MNQSEQPEWLKSYQQTNPAGHSRRGWLPGQSGNPQGKPKGAKNKKTLLAQELEQAGSQIATVVINSALQGDMQAANLVLQRISPPLRPRTEKVTFELSPDASLTTQAQQIMTAISKGEISPETGQLLISCISSYAGIKATDELEQRLIALEEKRQ